MLRQKFDEILESYISEGFKRGMELFIESIEDDLAKEEALTEGNNLEIYLERLTESIQL